jgi:hypothetical protein
MHAHHHRRLQSQSALLLSCNNGLCYYIISHNKDRSSKQDKTKSLHIVTIIPPKEMSATETTELAGEYSACTTSYYPHFNFARLLIKESNTFPFHILLGYDCVTVTKTPQSPAKGSTISLRSLFDALPKFCAGEMEMCMEDELNDTFLVSDSDSVDFFIPEEHADCKQ